MRKKRNNQREFFFQASKLQVTQQYYERYECISEILDDNSKILECIHADLKDTLERRKPKGPGRKPEYTSENVLRIAICHILEGQSLRDLVCRIDDSSFLRHFVRVYNGAMMDFTTFCSLKNVIRPKTWKKINVLLNKTALSGGLISGEKLRMDTSAVETNIRWPTDSGLLWDTYRVMCRLVKTVREIDPLAACDRRLQPRRAKKLHTKIARRAGKKGSLNEDVRDCYTSLIDLVEGLLDWTEVVCERLRNGLECDWRTVIDEIIAHFEHFRSLGRKVVYQACRRVVSGEMVPNEEKLFSIFEPHTELLKRGKAGKPIEFGHMISIQQVEQRFISDYAVYEKRPVDHELVDPALKSHRKTFGCNPEELTADKGYYESMAKIRELEDEIEIVAICKKGNRTKEEAERESTPKFRAAQKFRAGVEGTISFLKRTLGLRRCKTKGWEHYACTVGAAVFVHNLLIIAGG